MRFVSLSTLAGASLAVSTLCLAPPAIARGSTGCAKTSQSSGLGRIGKRLFGIGLQKLGINGSSEIGSELTSMLSEALMCALNPEQQGKATEATEKALNTPKSNVPASWQSASDPNVSGASTASAPVRSADGSVCAKLAKSAMSMEGRSRLLQPIAKHPAQKPG